MRSPKQVDPFYKSKEWHRVRQKALIRDHFSCVNCGTDVRAKGASRVDHIRPRKKYPDLALASAQAFVPCASLATTLAHAHDRHSVGGGKEVTPVGDDGFPVGTDWSDLGS